MLRFQQQSKSHHLPLSLITYHNHWYILPFLARTKNIWALLNKFSDLIFIFLINRLFFQIPPCLFSSLCRQLSSACFGRRGKLLTQDENLAWKGFQDRYVYFVCMKVGNIPQVGTMPTSLSVAITQVTCWKQYYVQLHV